MVVDAQYKRPRLALDLLSDGNSRVRYTFLNSVPHSNLERIKLCEKQTMITATNCYLMAAVV
jgi:hypothetical protein